MIARQRPANTMNVVARFFASWFVALPLTAMSAQTGPPAETIGALLLRVQEESAVPFVRYCGGKVPDLKRPLESEYSRFRKKFRKATAALRAQIGANDALAKPASPELIEQFEVMRAQDFARVTGVDPLAFCPTLRQNLATATVESIQKSMESAFAQYRAAARQGG